MDRLDAMRSFRRVVELGSFAKAAEDLCLSPAGLSKQIKLLEDHLGVVLLHRTTRTMSLSETGSNYFAECCRILDEVDELERSVSDDAAELIGRLRVNAPLSFGITVLSPILPKFAAAHPRLAMALTLDDKLLDPINAGFDVSIRVRVDLADSSMITRRIADVDQIICAAPAYLQVHGEPVTVGDLHGHACLSYSLADQPGIWRLNGPNGVASVAIATRLTANSSIILRDMLVAGLGIGALPEFLANPLIESGALVRLLEDYRFPVRHVFALYPTGRHLQRKVRAFIDFLAEELQGDA
ncbi:LysR family transcriptional regulator [Bradyrhizobium sp. SZCCHNR1070]|uniref:LysR family transcriptional regulator n=1 Tax=Bradyrhizobium sp. SZCCHNR1070 TaxID=3057361 RepID=UPI002916D18E|nr:LysR family transcriptional regulator [Bradyrhizobium sp. SZCCHNR1070]